MIQGRATTEGTARYRDRFKGRAAADHFREMRGLWLSSIGMGTYLGEPEAGVDRAYERSATEALLGGCNVLDTAVNYRFQRSERNLGEALASLLREGLLSREEIVVATKGGFVSFDGAYPKSPSRWIEETFVKPGIAAADDFVAGCHCMAPGYLEHELEASRKNLGLETIDIYYVHNPETQLQAVPRDVFLDRLTKAFEMLERKVAEGKIAMYGMATWDGFRRPPEDRGRLSLAEILRCAEAAGRAAGASPHHFAAVQLPLNLAMPEALLHPTQEAAPGTERQPFLAAAAKAGLIVMASASILQGHLIQQMPPQLAERIPGGDTLAQKAIQWVRSAPGLSTALVGMASPGHVEENLALMRAPRMTLAEYRTMLGRKS